MLENRQVAINKTMIKDTIVHLIIATMSFALGWVMNPRGKPCEFKETCNFFKKDSYTCNNQNEGNFCGAYKNYKEKRSDINQEDKKNVSN